jgi:ABC-type phosphate transport system permease subunit
VKFGGIANAIIGTFSLSLLPLIAIPLGISIVFILREFRKHKFAYYVRLGVDILQNTFYVIGMIAYLCG